MTPDFWIALSAICTLAAALASGLALYVKMTAAAATTELDKRLAVIEEQFKDIKTQQLKCYALMTAIARKMRLPSDYEYGDREP